MDRDLKRYTIVETDMLADANISGRPAVSREDVEGLKLLVGIID